MLLQVILEGLGLGALLVLVCAAGIRKGAVGMVHLYPMGQPFASIQSGLYVRLQRPERPFRQRFFPVSRQGRGQRYENADREDWIWRQAMKILVDVYKRQCVGRVRLGNLVDQNHAGIAIGACLNACLLYTSRCV